MYYMMGEFLTLIGDIDDIILLPHSAEFLERGEAMISRMEAELGEIDSMALPRVYGDLGRTPLP
jgi:hypothetical protein